MFTSLITHAGCWENIGKVCNSQARGEWLTNFLGVLWTSQVGYYKNRLIEGWVYLDLRCFNFLLVYCYNKQEVFDQSGCS